MKIQSKQAHDYLAFLHQIKEEINRARHEAYQSVNRSLIHVYWDIGKGIVERQHKFGWGRKIVEILSKDLRRDLPTHTGFSPQNLWYMRQFYLAYEPHPNLQQLVGEIPWGQNLVILAKTKTLAEKEFYLRETMRQGWTRSILVHQIESRAFQRFRGRQHNFKQALPQHLSEQADRALRDSYALDFLGLESPILERELESQLLVHLRDFLVELGMGFCFVGSQVRLTLREKEYFVDLLFFHRHLKCLVAIELKIGDFEPEYAGKMNFYLNLLDDQVKLSDENSSIGIILCKTKDRLEVEYALRGVDKPIGVAQYQLARTLPKKLERKLPSPQQLKSSLVSYPDQDAHTSPSK